MHVWVDGQSFVVWHWTQAPALQNGAVDGQSLFAAHWTQVLSVPQTVPVFPAQSAFDRHSTQRAWSASHAGVLPEHCADEVQPGTQVNVRGLQIGREVPQS